jgi:hypothetical protein
MESSMVVYGKRGCRVRDETGPREKKILPTKGLLILCETKKTYNKPKFENNSA